MKLAEALIERADLQRRLDELESRIGSNAIFQEGDTPSEDPTVLMKQFEDITARLEELIMKINMTNNETVLEEGTMMVAALAKRDLLKRKQKAYRGFATSATPSTNRYSSSEIRFVSALDVMDIQKKADKIAKQYREIDSAIQQANWITELKE